MSRPIIEAENLCKRYRLGHLNAQTMREEVERFFARFWAKRAGKGRNFPDESSEFWALKGISFSVQPGEVVGIIGRNGAGKSTLLKILSRVTEPTAGQARIRGRVASLLQVGTGFHPELTGRENVFLNGAILGMTRLEIHKKFDEIAAFAEVDDFLDTPVKRYSSGMYVRLAFAVAAHLEPEILIVDEVLAVGDWAFQKKCLAKMREVTRGGKTILFVSHQLNAISNLCSRTIVLNHGQISFLGDTQSAIAHYLSKEQSSSLGTDLPATSPRSGSRKVLVRKIWISDLEGREQAAVASGQTVVFNFSLSKQTPKSIDNVSIGFSIHDSVDGNLSILYSDYSGDVFSLNCPETTISCTMNNFPFSMGKYLIRVRIVGSGEELDWPREFAAVLNVENGDFYNSSTSFHGGIGPVLLSGQWSIQTPYMC
jgi:lipopolysaccharide transport system ATP-binding protein